jgi:uncharacterized protein (TIGR01777 family)
MTKVLWGFVLVQIALGGFDTLYHHELTERLAWRPLQMGELRLHGMRNLLYAAMFMALGWSEPHGAATLALIALLGVELAITLWDFVEEDRTRKLPASERITHTLLTLNYGVILALLAPVLGRWLLAPTSIDLVGHGVFGWLCAIAACGVVVSGARDLAAASRAERIVASEPATLTTGLREPRSVLVTGGTGFVGRRLVEALIAAGHDVTVLTRSRALAADLPAPIRIVTRLDQIADETAVDAIVNLAGEPISDGLWTRRKRFRILRSRLRITRDVVRLMARLTSRPAVLISGSAIGWYGLRGDEVLDETSDGAPCFSRTLCQAWEAEARRAETLGVRVVCLRIGLVLAAEGGMLSRMLTPFEFGLGGPFGAGQHWMSWVHRDDLIRLIIHAMADTHVSGPLNAVAPGPVQNAAFAKALGHALGRPALLPAPALPLHLALGAFADELLLSGQRIVPNAALASGFKFTHVTVDSALAAIVGRRPATRADVAGRRRHC